MTNSNLEKGIPCYSLYFHSVIYNKAEKRATMVISADGINTPGASVAYCE